MELYLKSATELSSLLRNKEISAVEIANSAFSRISQVDSDVQAFLLQTKKEAMQKAQQVDEKIAKNQPVGLLAGIPVGVKDNICTKGIRTTCASRMLADFHPPYSATVVEKLNNADALMVGKLNLDEFAMGATSETSYFQKTHNPLDLQRVPGGSSGGSAAAVAAFEVPLSLGTDTGGSVRTPAAFCGVVGLKPTYGTISRFGVVAVASSLEQVGPIARTVDDMAMVFSAICGEDALRDATSKEYSVRFPLEVSLKDLVIGLPKEYFGKGITKEVRDIVRKAALVLEKQGAKIEEMSIPSAQYALPAYYSISAAEAASNLARFDGIKYGFSAGRGDTLEEMITAARTEGFGDEVKRRILLGTFVLSRGNYDAYYKRAKLLQRQLERECALLFQRYDFILTPTAPHTALEMGEKVADLEGVDSTDLCAVLANLAGLPAISLPCGFDSLGLPVGMQLIGSKFSDGLLLGAAKGYETAVGGFAGKAVEN